MSDRTIGVLGLARSGRAAAQLALTAGARVFASDGGDSQMVRDAADAVRALGGEAETGRHSIERLAACDLLVLSPGIPPTAPVLTDPRLARVERISELEFAFRHLRAPVIAVTGTNGKSTTTAWIAHLLRAAGWDAPAAGNIGLALSEVALREPAPAWVVVEASSFQLADIRTFAPRVGVLTSLAPDHLDRYENADAYYADKARLFSNATRESTWVLVADNPAVVELAGNAPGRRLIVRTGSPLHQGEDGGFVLDGNLVVRRNGADDVLIPAAKLLLLGAHNRANALAAALAALAAGAPLDAVRAGLGTFRPLPHRLEPVAERNGALWINDSKATNIESTRVALRSMERPTVLLLGGRHKGEPYTALSEDLRRVRLVIAFGEAAPIIAQDLGGTVDVEVVDGPFDAVIEHAAARTNPGDALLLSPACASFDMFADYEERGRRFTELARRESEARIAS